MSWVSPSAPSTWSPSAPNPSIRPLSRKLHRSTSSPREISWIVDHQLTSLRHRSPASNVQAVLRICVCEAIVASEIREISRSVHSHCLVLIQPKRSSWMCLRMRKCSASANRNTCRCHLWSIQSRKTRSKVIHKALPSIWAALHLQTRIWLVSPNHNSLLTLYWQCVSMRKPTTSSSYLTFYFYK